MFFSEELNPILFGLFLSNIFGGGVFSTPPPYDFFLRVEIGECDTCH